ncbi:MAG: AI-2E family transporter [Synechococcales cyanobacterium RU_4_20]|nr:AI-2E family transporter [Synechococcales cyanobacterium RU_4_20]
MALGEWLGLLSLGAAFYILWQIRQLVLLLFTAVVLATTANSLVRRFERLGFKRGSALLLTIGVCLIVAILFFALVVPPFVEQVQELVQLVPSGLSRIRQVIPNVIDFLIRFIPPGADGIKDALELAKSMALNEMVEGSTSPTLTWDFTWLPDQAGNIVTSFFAFLTMPWALRCNCCWCLF